MISRRQILGVLSRSRLIELSRALGIPLSGRLVKDELVESVAGSRQYSSVDLPALLRRDELKSVCLAAGLDPKGAARES